MKKTLLLFAVVGLLFSCSKDDNLTITNVSVSDNQEEGRLEITWDPGDCEEVEIYRSTGSDAPVKYAETTYSKKFYDEDIEIGETYNYKIVSIDPTGVESDVVSIVCPEFSTRFGDINFRQDGRHVIFDYTVRFAKPDQNLSVSISTTDYMWSEEVEVVGNSGSITHSYGASPEQYNYYNIGLWTEGVDEALDYVSDRKFYCEHTYSLSPSNVNATITSSSSRTIEVTWDAASDAEFYTVAAEVGNTTYDMDEGVSDTSVELSFPSDADLSTGTIVEITVTGYGTFNGTQYSSDSETIELEW